MKKLQNHGYESQSKLRGILPSASRDCSTYQFQHDLFSELEFHNKQRHYSQRATDIANIVTLER
jgi:hypothetical protein